METWGSLAESLLSPVSQQEVQAESDPLEFNGPRGERL
jgi:hypothetical protein